MPTKNEFEDFLPMYDQKTHGSLSSRGNNMESLMDAPTADFDHLEIFYENYHEYMLVKHETMRAYMHISAEEVLSAY